MYLVNSLFHFQNNNLRNEIQIETIVCAWSLFCYTLLSVLSGCGAYLICKKNGKFV